MCAAGTTCGQLNRGGCVCCCPLTLLCRLSGYWSHYRLTSFPPDTRCPGPLSGGGSIINCYKVVGQSSTCRTVSNELGCHCERGYCLCNPFGLECRACGLCSSSSSRRARENAT